MTLDTLKQVVQWRILQYQLKQPSSLFEPTLDAFGLQVMIQLFASAPADVCSRWIESECRLLRARLLTMYSTRVWAELARWALQEPTVQVVPDTLQLRCRLDNKAWGLLANRDRSPTVTVANGWIEGHTSSFLDLIVKEAGQRWKQATEQIRAHTVRWGSAVRRDARLLPLTRWLHTHPLFAAPERAASTACNAVGLRDITMHQLQHAMPHLKFPERAVYNRFMLLSSAVDTERLVELQKGTHLRRLGPAEGELYNKTTTRKDVVDTFRWIKRKRIDKVDSCYNLYESGMCAFAKSASSPGQAQGQCKDNRDAILRRPTTLDERVREGFVSSPLHFVSYIQQHTQAS
jgi:hypothetical protein